ncbi:MAG: YidC/Oxa1 family membrane protein insertase, partial [Clostridiales bacterium]|nr:YidC/Oxa1 family membrane protein insertase [Clostridiales bacterium]
MAVLISSVADLLHDPGGLWELLILKVFKFIGNYGWRILFFTVCLKLLLFPLDLYQRIKMRKNQIITERIKPQMDQLQQQYAGDRQMLARKQSELNKREGFSYFSSCLPMLVTLVIFFYLFAGLNNISQYKNFKQYAELY